MNFEDVKDSYHIFCVNGNLSIDVVYESPHTEQVWVNSPSLFKVACLVTVYIE